MDLAIPMYKYIQTLSKYLKVLSKYQKLISIMKLLYIYFSWIK